MRIGVVSLGCAKNLVDTERMLGLLKAAGHAIVSSPESAEAIIVNTCGFIEPAKQESINTILEMAQYKKSGLCKRLVVTGCLGERYRAELREAMPEIDILLGVREYARLPGLLDPCAAAPACRPPRLLTTPPWRAYLRIADGCDNRCAYCAIPLIRGALKSEPLEALAGEAAALVAGGVTELTLIAQDSSGYGRELYGTPMLQELMRRLCTLEGLRWLRVLYTYPDTVTPALIDFMRSDARIVPYLDMPMQHASDAVLRRMNRRGSAAHCARVLDYTAENAPDFTLRTTMMVGFPGETDEDFETLLRFLREHPFHRVGAFAFSAEEGTAAAAMPNQVPEAVRQERLDALMAQQRDISARLNERRVGTETEVLVEGRTETGFYGRSRAEAPDDIDGRILLPDAGGLVPGSYVLARLVSAQPYDMTGEWICNRE
ncbi:MAG: 30S ribosomal protein S12 methylthiotransferase RimO [Clostridia bacterium]|nr:30S ribosomal protein S12 methylthiotransferase RimO [Clostridia bacterium]